MGKMPRYTVFWLAALDRERVPSDVESAIADYVQFLERSEGTQLRGAYLSVGFRPDVDLILWV